MSAALERRKEAEVAIEVALERLATDEARALLYTILRALGWTEQRATLVLRKAQWSL